MSALIIKPSFANEAVGLAIFILLGFVVPGLSYVNFHEQGFFDPFFLGLGLFIYAWFHFFFRGMRLRLLPDILIYRPLTLKGYLKKTFAYDEVTFAGIVGLSFVIVRNGHTPKPEEMTTNKHPDYIFIPIGNFSKDSRYQLYEFLESKNIKVENKK